VRMWPDSGGHAEVLQPATGRAGKFTRARHVRPPGNACLGSRWWLSRGQLGGMAWQGWGGSWTGAHCTCSRRNLMLERVYLWFFLQQGCAPSRELGRRGPRRHPRGLHHNLLARLCRLGRRAPGLSVMPAQPCQSQSSVLDPR